MSLSLDQITIAKPCSANWNEMSGDERVRHCALCKLNVYNLSEMTREEATKFVNEREGTGRTCIQFYRRADGKMLTKDCPVGLARIRRRMAVLSGALAASFLMAAGSVLAKFGMSGTSGQAPAQAVKQWLNPPTPQVLTGAVRGDMCVVPVSPPASPTLQPTSPATPAQSQR